MLPGGIQIFRGFVALYVGLIVFIAANVIVYLTYQEVPATSPLDPVMYLGLVLMLVGPAWFWFGRPLLFKFRERREEGELG